MLLIFGVIVAQAEKLPASSMSVISGGSISQDQLKTKIDALASKQELEETTKSKILSLYQSARDNLTNSASFVAKTAEFEAAVKQAPENTKKLQRDIGQGQQKLTKQKTEDYTRIPDDELEQRLIFEKEKITSLDEQVKTLEKDLALQIARPEQIRQEAIVARQVLEDAQKKLAIPPPTNASLLENEAQQINLNTLIDARNAELKMLSVEAISNPVRVDLLKANLQLAGIQKDLLSPVVTAIESLVNERRQQEAIQMQNELTQAEKAASGKHPLIQQTTQENIQYSRDLQTITAKIEKYSDLKNRIVANTSEIDADFKSAEKKISLAGLSPVLGKILREQRRNLAGRDQFVQEADALQNETASTSLEQFKIDDRLKLLSDLDTYLKDLMSRQVDNTLPANDRMMVQAELRVLLNSQKELLNKLSGAYTGYLRTLGDFDFAEQQMLVQTNKFAAYLDERLLWVPSSVPINSAFLPGLYESFRWFLSPSNWLALIKDTLMIAWEKLFLTIIAVLAALASPMLRSWAKRQLTVISGKVESIHTDSFYYTLTALGYTLILVLPIPLFLYFGGWFLGANPHGVNFSIAIGLGMKSCAIPLFALQFMYRLFAENGIAIKHFRWQKQTAELLKRQAAWLRFVVTCGVFIITSTGASAITRYSDNLGRLALMVVMIAMAVFFARLLNPRTGLLQDYIKNRPYDWLTKLRYIWYPLIIVIPVIVIGFAAAGYYLSALELQQKLVITIRLIFIVVIIYSLVIRWLTFVNRQLALTNAMQKRIAAAQTEKQIKTAAGGEEDPVLPLDEQLIDIPTINAQTIKLLVMCIGFGLIIGFWMIWRNILPAFSFLEYIVLWQRPVMVDKQEIMQPITLTNLLMAGLYVFVMIVLVRNFSGIMELLMFRHMSIQPGGRYAVNQLAKYGIIAIGFISVANELGGSWSQVQWLVAALSVGLGFGLQEIFANLVSGIILLFERPIRVGDTVTINSVTGKVSRIQMRATTIMDWDHKELIVPNKTFITNQLINWTLSDTTTRVVIPIKIAYGSDVGVAHKLMLEAAQATPLVLGDPAPTVTLVGIVDSALEFSIKVFVNELAHRQPVTNNLLISLEKRLCDNHIELPSPNKNS